MHSFGDIIFNVLPCCLLFAKQIYNMGPNLRGVTPNFIFIPRSVVIQNILADEFSSLNLQ
jgi:hypothetical protein